MQRLSFIILLFLTVVTTGCDGASELAAKIEGTTWTCGPEPLELNHAAPATITTTLIFGPGKSNMGKVRMESVIDADSAGVAEITGSGTYRVTSSTTMKLNVDTTTVELISYTPHRPGAPAPETLKAGIAAQLKHELQAVMTERCSRYSSIRDIQVNDGMMQWWSGGRKTVLTAPSFPPVEPG